MALWAAALLVTSCDGGGDSVPPAPAAPDVLYADDFDDPGSGWLGEEGAVELPYAAARIADGGLEVRITKDALFYTTSTEATGARSLSKIGDVVVRVDAAATEDPEEDLLMGLVCRHDPKASSGYILRVATDGSYQITRMKEGAPTALEQGRVQFDPAKVSLRAECRGPRLTLFVDDEKVASVRDDRYVTGAVGMFTAGSTGSSVRYDNLVIDEP